MPDNPYWAAAKAAYKSNDRSWLPCTEDFFEDMLNVVPPVCFDHHPALGCHFGCGECWNHTPAGAPIFLMFRSLPKPACRLATPAEFRAERAAAIPPDWQLLSPETVTEICERILPGDREQWESDAYKRCTEKMALEAVHGDNLTYIEGRGWFAH